MEESLAYIVGMDATPYSIWVHSVYNSATLFT